MGGFGSYASLLGQSQSGEGGNSQLAMSGGLANEVGVQCLVPVDV